MKCRNPSGFDCLLMASLGEEGGNGNMGIISGMRSIYQEAGISAVAVGVLDRLRQSMSRDFRPMIAYAEAEDAKLTGSSDFHKILQSHDGHIVTKWAHYPDIYEAHFSRFRGTQVRFLEIGVFKGGSLDIWRKFFGPKATIFGIDIDPECAQFDGQSGSVRIGSQADEEFLRRVIDEMGGVDVVLDDGSHNSRHMRKTLSILFPLLSEGGLYMIEDLHCAYLPRFGGGLRWPWSFMSDMKAIIDDMHHWYHGSRQRHPDLVSHLQAMHCYDSVVVFDKQKQSQPISLHRPLGRQ